MKTLIKSTKFIDLYHDEEYAIYSWQFLPSTAEIIINNNSIKEVFYLMMSGMKECNPDYVIADDRENLAIFSVELQGWIAKTTIESLKGCNVKKFAVVRPKDEINDMATKQAVVEARKLAQGIEIELFSDLDKAEQWVKL